MKIMPGMLLLSAALSTVSVMAFPKENEALEFHRYEYDTYWGVNYKFNHFKPQTQWEGVLFKNHPGFDVYAGWRFHTNFGLEMGYEWTANKPKTLEVLPNESVLGSTNQTGTPVILTGKLRVKSGHVDINAFLPLPFENERQPEIVMSLGLATTKAHTRFSYSPENPLTEPFGGPYQKMKGRSKTILRAGLGFQSLLIENVGVRVLWRFENTAHLRVRNTDFADAPKMRKLLSNGHSCALGLFMKF